VPKQDKPKQEEHVNPLLQDTSNGFDGAPKGWGVVEEEKVIPAPIPEPVPTPSLPPLLYQSAPSAEYMARPFDRRYDKQAANVNPYLHGALAALTRILKQTKTEQFEEMMLDYLKKHTAELERYPDLVRYYDEEMRKKHNL